VGEVLGGLEAVNVGTARSRCYAAGVSRRSIPKSSIVGSPFERFTSEVHAAVAEGRSEDATTKIETVVVLRTGGRST
jgi:hypothetical protein